MKSRKILIAVVLLVLAIFTNYSLPKVKYTSTGFISELKIPLSFPGWTGKDVTQEIGLNLSDDKYNFVSGAIANQYVNSEGKPLIFIILDAGNFHHPKVCLTSSGFKIKEQPDTTFRLSDHTLLTHTLFTERGRDNFLTFYWIVIDKKVAHEWIEQKFKQLYFSLLNKKRVGLMVRLDIPVKEENIENATRMAKQFITDLSKDLRPEHSDYIFGRRTEHSQ